MQPQPRQPNSDEIAGALLEVVDEWHEEVRQAFAYAPSVLNYTDKTDEVAFIDRHAITINEKYVVKAVVRMMEAGASLEEAMGLAKKYFQGEDGHEHGHLHHWGAPIDTRNMMDYLKIIMEVMDDKKLVAAPFLANVVYDVITDTGNYDNLPHLIDVEVSPLVIYDFYKDYDPEKKSAVDQFLVAYKEAIKGVEFDGLDLREDVREVSRKCVSICRDLSKNMEQKIREITKLVFQLFKDASENPPPPPKQPPPQQQQSGESQDKGDGQDQKPEQNEGEGEGDQKPDGESGNDPKGPKEDEESDEGEPGKEKGEQEGKGKSGKDKKGETGDGNETGDESESGDNADEEQQGDEKKGKQKQKKGNKSHEEFLQELAEAIKNAMIQAGKKLDAPVKEDMKANPLAAKMDVVDWSDEMEIFMIGQLLNLSREVLHFYELQAKARRELRFHVSPSGPANENTFLAGHLPWDPCMPVEDLDMQASFAKYGTVIFGATTVMPLFGTGQGTPGEGEFPRMKILIDFSGSMDADQTLIAGFSFIEAARTRRVPVAGTLFADYYYDIPFTMEYDEAQHLMYDHCNRVGGGNSVPGIVDTADLKAGDLALYVTDFGLWPEHQTEALAAIASLRARGVIVIFIVMFIEQYVEAAKVAEKGIRYKFCETIEQLADIVLETVDEHMPR